MSEHPITILAVLFVSIYLGVLWCRDYREGIAGNPHPRALPGATRAPRSVIILAVGGALFLLAVETLGELALGVADRQTDIAGVALFGMIAAGFVEEIFFRGFLVIDKRGKTALYGSIVFFSAAFALLHVQYWMVPSDSGWWPTGVDFSSKAGWTLLILFSNSLWFYALRFNAWNPNRSLLPCFAGHIASNVGVFVVKLCQGHVTGLW